MLAAGVAAGQNAHNLLCVYIYERGPGRPAYRGTV